LTALRRATVAARVEIDPIDEQSKALWTTVIDLTEELPAENWALVGGLMVQMHGQRYAQAGARPTEDIDILADSRARPSRTEALAKRLVELGYEVAHTGGLAATTPGYRFIRGESIVDVLGPDGMKRNPPKTISNAETIQVKGGTQALARAEVIEVRIASGRAGIVRCPSLTAAILLKARAIQSDQREQDRQDLALLLSCVEEPTVMKAELTGNEVQWLRAAESRLRLHEPDLEDQLSRDQLRRARAAYRILAQ
jgi:predicted nucleotidyltransferase